MLASRLFRPFTSHHEERVGGVQFFPLTSKKEGDERVTEGCGQGGPNGLTFLRDGGAFSLPAVAA